MCRLAMRSACTSECDGGEITYSWDILNLPNIEVSTVYCDEDLMTTTSTTTSTTTTTLPPAETIVGSTYLDNTTGIVYTASASNGSIIVSFDDGTSTNSTRRKRQIGSTYSEGEAVSTEQMIVSSHLCIREACICENLLIF